MSTNELEQSRTSSLNENDFDALSISDNQRNSSSIFTMSSSTSPPPMISLPHQQPQLQHQPQPLATQNQGGMTVLTNPMTHRANIDPELSKLLIRKQPSFVPQAPKCAHCQKSVYKAEEIRAANKTFHKLCFKCNLCSKLLETNILTEHQGDLFCRNCYGKKFGPKGYGYGGGAGTLSTDTGSFGNVIVESTNSLTHSNEATTNGTANGNNSNRNSSISNGGGGGGGGSNENDSKIHNIVHSNGLRSTFSSYQTNDPNGNGNNNTNNGYVFQNIERKNVSSNPNVVFGGSDKCARCQKAVYAAEKVIAAGKPFHKLCFTCYSCKKMLSSMNCCDNNNGNEVYCKSCYSKQFGPKGVGYGVGAGTLSTN